MRCIFIKHVRGIISLRLTQEWEVNLNRGFHLYNNCDTIKIARLWKRISLVKRPVSTRTKTNMLVIHAYWCLRINVFLISMCLPKFKLGGILSVNFSSNLSGKNYFQLILRHYLINLIPVNYETHEKTLSKFDPVLQKLSFGEYFCTTSPLWNACSGARYLMSSGW